MRKICKGKNIEISILLSSFKGFTCGRFKCQSLDLTELRVKFKI